MDLAETNPAPRRVFRLRRSGQLSRLPAGFERPQVRAPSAPESCRRYAPSWHRNAPKVCFPACSSGAYAVCEEQPSCRRPAQPERKWGWRGKDSIATAKRSKGWWRAAWRVRFGVRSWWAPSRPACRVGTTFCAFRGQQLPRRRCAPSCQPQPLMLARPARAPA